MNIHRPPCTGQSGPWWPGSGQSPFGFPSPEASFTGWPAASGAGCLATQKRQSVAGTGGATTRSGELALDLNKIVPYGNPDGTMREDKGFRERKRHYVFADGILAGEGRGPMNPDPVEAGIMVFGLHPAPTDAACTVLMGYDPDKVPIVRQAFRCDRLPLADWAWNDVALISNVPEWNGPITWVPTDSTFRFNPHFGWRGHIERERPGHGPPDALAAPTDNTETQ